VIAKNFRKRENSIDYGEDVLAFLKSHREYNELSGKYSQHQSQKDIVEMTANRVGFKLPLIESLEEEKDERKDSNHS
jgi:hypothetical protein